MRDAVKFIFSLVTASLAMLVFRALVFTIYTVPQSSKDMVLQKGDRVMVNRWSYGLRAGDNVHFPYSRWMHSQIKKGDIVAFNNPSDKSRRVSARNVLLGRITACPEDTVSFSNQIYVLPHRCSREIPLYIIRSEQGEHLVPENHIIGEAFVIIYGKTPGTPIYNGYIKERWFRLIKKDATAL